MVGEFKDDRIQSHEHIINAVGSSTANALGVYSSAGGNGNYFNLSGGQGSLWNYIGVGLPKDGCRNGNTTRVKSKGIKYIIKIL